MEQVANRSQSETVLAAARSAVDAAARRNAELVRSVEALDIRIPSSEWTVADAAGHLVVSARILTEIAAGTPSPIVSLARPQLAAENARRIDELDESDPLRLSELLTDAVHRLVEVSGQYAPDKVVEFHQRTPLPLWALVCIALGEQILHGYDMATALGRPSPISREDATLVLSGFAPVLPLIVNPETAGDRTAAFEIDVASQARFVARFAGGGLHVEPVGNGTVDCTLSADPVALLLVSTGRLSRWPAIALGLISTGGAHPELGPGFFDLLMYP